MSFILNLIPQYGYALVFILLAIELMGVPFLPGEILVTYCGFLVFKGELNFVLLTIIATLGVCTGLTTSYFVGKKLGAPFFEKHGEKIHLGKDRMDKISGLINRYGTALIFFICFIPGLKHIIGYFSGMSSMKYKRYAIGGYLGAIVWAITFITLGDILGNNWSSLHKYVEKYLIVGAIIMIVAISIFYLIRIYKTQIIDFIERAVLKLLRVFHSLGKIRIFVLITAVICILLVDAFVNIIQGLVSNQFAPFNEITDYIIHRVFSNFAGSEIIFKAISLLESNIMYIVIAVLLIAYISYKSRNKSIEIKYTLITLLGGFVVQQILNYTFKFLSSYISVLDNIFNIKCFNVIVIYGFVAYILFKNTKHRILRKSLIVVFLIISALTGLAAIFFNNSLSEILAGYSLGGAWLTLNIILLEITKILPSLSDEY